MPADRITHLPTEVERYELREGPAYRFDANRREFVQVLGAGLVVAVAVSNRSLAQRRGGPASRRAEPLAERFHLGADGVITVLSSKVEVGQGSRTQIAQAAAEELGVPLEAVQVVLADTELCPDDGGTAGSRTTPSTVPRVRAAAAALRQVLCEAAAERLQARAEAVEFRGTDLVAGNSDRRIALADLVQDEALQERLRRAGPEGISVKPVDQWKVLGTSARKVNGRDVVTGAAKYPSDIVLPGMLYGKVLRPPSYGARLEAIDLRPAESIEGVAVVRDGNFIGCAAETSWKAQQALDLIAATATWLPQDHPSSAELFAHLKNRATRQGSGWPSPRTDRWGALDTSLAEARKTMDWEFTIPYIQHAPMEPRAAVAQWADGKLTVWTGTQQPSRVRGELVEAFRLREDQVRVIVPDTGGGFGGKHSGEAAVEAARLAKAAGRPVSLRWTRQEEFTWAYFRPAGVIEIQAGLDDRGRLIAWDFTNYNSGASAIATPYQVPNGRTQFLASDSPLRQGSYRALASTANTFARESAMDDLAAAVGEDPLAFRLQHLPQGRLRDVLVAAATKFDWRSRQRDPARRRGVGLACGTEKGSYTAACVEVEVDDGHVRVLSVCQAFECGAIQNPSNLRAQVEGCIIMGLGGALSEKIEFEGGRILNASFSQYRVPRMADVPPLEVVLVDRPDIASVGAGETPIIAIAPAIANAVFHATGVRLRSLPLALDSPEREDRAAG